MEGVYSDIKQELEAMKRELEARLQQESIPSYYLEISEETFPFCKNENYRKRKMVLQHIEEDLKDIERALIKMEIGMYGICEHTGSRLPLHQLTIMPTARTIDEFIYMRL
ncbi:hypothetical protein ACFDTO_26075 [Microbacteriaceae bacterium 4G12]